MPFCLSQVANIGLFLKLCEVFEPTERLFTQAFCLQFETWMKSGFQVAI